MEYKRLEDEMDVHGMTLTWESMGMVLGKGGTTFKVICSHCGVFGKVDKTETLLCLTYMGMQVVFT